MKLTTATATIPTYFASVPLFGAFVPTAPGDLNPGDSFHYLAVSISSTNAVNLNDAHYNGIASTDATTSGLNTIFGQAATWGALVSTTGGTDAFDKFDPSSPIYLLDGTLVATNGADLWDGSISTPVNLDMDGGLYNAQIWTGSAIDGTGEIFKELGDSSPNVGISNSTSGAWMKNDDIGQGSSLPIYTFSSELTVVSEPEQIATGVIAGIFALIATRLRRRKAAQAE